jgi:hypothetical protein
MKRRSPLYDYRLFAVLAHGLAAVAFWRTGLLIKLVGSKTVGLVARRRSRSPLREKP